MRLGRELLAQLPAGNRLRRHHEERWALDTAADANFADMYLHPQETRFTLASLLAFVAEANLHLAGFSNPEVWDPARLLSGELLERARALPERRQWELVEALDPDISHFEVFLSREPVHRRDWSDDRALLAASGEANRCLWGWPGTALLDPDLRPLDIDPGDLALMEAWGRVPVGTALADLPLAMEAGERLERARRLNGQRVLLPVAP